MLKMIAIGNLTGDPVLKTNEETGKPYAIMFEAPFCAQTAIPQWDGRFACYAAAGSSAASSSSFRGERNSTSVALSRKPGCRSGSSAKVIVSKSPLAAILQHFLANSAQRSASTQRT